MFDAYGRYIRSFRPEGVQYVYGLCLDSEENYFLITDRNQKTVYVCDVNGALITRFLPSEINVKHALCVCTDADNRMFVAGEDCRVRVLAFVDAC